MRIYNIFRPPDLIELGFDGENKWRPRGFDCTDWLQKHPDGIITLWVQPEGVKKAFPVSTTKIENTIVWYPLSEELYPGSGELQLVIQDGEFVGKSDTIKFEVNKSLVSGGVHPDSQPSWATKMVDDVTAQADRAAEAAERAEQASGEEVISEAVENYFEEHPVVVEEIDPTVPAWAKQPQKPSYTAAEVGALPDNYTAPVQSVNGKTGAVNLEAADVNALPAGTRIPSKTSDLTNDSGFITASQVPSAPVQSVNTKTGAVVLSASDVGAMPSSYVAPVTSVNGQTGDVVLDAEDVGITFMTAAEIDAMWGSIDGLPDGDEVSY